MARWKIRKPKPMEEPWVEVGRKGINLSMIVQMRSLSTSSQAVVFRIIDETTGRTVVEPWVLERDLINILYNGLLILKKSRG